MTADHPLVAEMLELLGQPVRPREIGEAQAAIYEHARVALAALQPRLDVEQPGGVDRVQIRQHLIGLAAASLATAKSLGLETRGQAIDKSIPF